MRASRTALLPILIGFVLVVCAATVFQQRNSVPVDGADLPLDPESAEPTQATLSDTPTPSLASTPEPLRRLPAPLPVSKPADRAEDTGAHEPEKEDLNQWAASYETQRLREQLANLIVRARTSGADTDTFPSHEEIAQFDSATLRLWIFLVGDQLKRNTAAAQTASTAANKAKSARDAARRAPDTRTRVVRDYQPSPFAAPGRMDHRANRVPSALQARHQGRAPFLTSTTESDKGTTVYIIDPYQPLYRVTGPVRGGANAGSSFNSSR